MKRIPKDTDKYDPYEIEYLKQERRFNILLVIISILVFGFVLFAFHYAL